jgi:hypothetical protein
MKFLEKVLIVLAIIGVVFRVAMWQGGELFLTVALPSLSVLYLLMSWSVFKAKDEGHNIFLSVLSGIAFSVVFMGILLKLMIWRGGNFLLVTGLFILIVSQMIGLLLKMKHASALENYFSNLFLRYYLIALIALGMWLIPYKNIAGIYYRNDPEYVRLFVRHFEEPSNMQYRSEFFEYRRNKSKKKWNTKGSRLEAGPEE